MLKRKKIKFIINVIILLITINSIGQKTKNDLQEFPNEKYTIKWVDQFPKSVDVKRTKKGWFSRFLFGEKNNPEITKPIAILALNPSEFSILDQGSGTLFEIKDNEKKISKAFKKSKINFPSLVSYCKIPTNELLITDSRLNAVYKLNEAEKKLTVLNTNLQLQQPTGIAYSEVSKEIWIVETAAHRISILNEKGELIKTIGRRGDASGEFNFPTSIWIDKIGNAYVIDALNFRVQIFNKEGEVISIFGEAGNATGYFARPKGIATDSKGNIYISDALYHTVQVFDITGNFLYQFGEQGRDKGQFWMPAGIYIDDNDFIYVADMYNARVQIFQRINKE
ncbi:MAG: 6-bladed beta-propeller [Lutibacter sp.]|nr:6-bladed beta-propeller [Lutibacter sp.]